MIENSCSVHDVPIGQYLLLPHYLSPGETDSPPQLTSTHVHVASHTTSTNAGTARDNSHKGTNGNKLTRTCTAYNSPRRPVDTNNPLTERASAMFAEYNATWDELECRLNKTDLKGMFNCTRVSIQCGTCTVLPKPFRHSMWFPIYALNCHFFDVAI